MGALYTPDAAAGLRYDDPALGINWPHAPESIHRRDAEYALIDKENFQP